MSRWQWPEFIGMAAVLVDDVAWLSFQLVLLQVKLDWYLVAVAGAAVICGECSCGCCQSLPDSFAVAVIVAS